MEMHNFLISAKDVVFFLKKNGVKYFLEYFDLRVLGCHFNSTLAPSING